MGEELETAITACKVAGKVLLEHFHKPLDFVDKGNSNIVSEADKASENVILDILTQRFPDHAYYSEEAGFSAHRSRNMWVVDPLDGTSNFAIGSPTFAISIALIKNGSVALGVIYQPFLDILLSAVAGKGAFINGRRIEHEKDPEGCSQVISIIAGYPNQHLQKQMIHDLSDKVKRILTHWAPSVDFLMLSTGKIDSIISLESETEDQLAGLLIAKEAGCSVKLFDGGDLVIQEFSEFLPSMVISRSESFHADILRLLR
ncbi:inositol monophosphatase [Candidatus Woesearchaeota archaeon]|nr:inositol monophosphatase [Candidatus Woesearchaeota archaeon]